MVPSQLAAPVSSAAPIDDPPATPKQSTAQERRDVEDKQPAGQQAGGIDIDKEIADIVKNFNSLVKTGRYDKAQALAAEAAKLYGPKRPGMEAMVRKASVLRKQAYFVSYNIKDLPFWTQEGKHQDVDLLLKYIQATIDPPSWKSKEFQAGYYAQRFQLVVSASGPCHKQIEEFLDTWSLRLQARHMKSLVASRQSFLRFLNNSGLH